MRTTIPVQGTNKVLEGNSNRRDRVLTNTELKKIWNQLDDDDYGKICPVADTQPASVSTKSEVCNGPNLNSIRQ